MGGASGLQRLKADDAEKNEEASMRPLWKYIPSVKNQIPEVVLPLKKGNKGVDGDSHSPGDRSPTQKNPYNDKFRDGNMNLYRDIINQDRHRT